MLYSKTKTIVKEFEDLNYYSTLIDYLEKYDDDVEGKKKLGVEEYQI
jgi:hypothetical protein